MFLSYYLFLHDIIYIYNSSLAPSGLLHALWAQFNYMAAYEQQDAHEFLVALLDGLSTHLHRNHGVDCSVLQHFMPPPVTETAQTQTGGITGMDPVDGVGEGTGTGESGEANSPGGGGACEGEARGRSPDLHSVSGNGPSGAVDVNEFSSYFSTGHFKFHGIVNEVYIM